MKIMFNYLLIVLMSFLSIAFFTIMERKILGILHLRIGPSKVGIIGIFQPFSDAIKLFSKNLNFLKMVYSFYWNFSPIFLFIMFMILLKIFPIKMENNMMNFNFLVLIFIMGIPTFLLFWSSFFSMSKFSVISSKRCVSQMLSYEMGLMLILIFFSILLFKINLENLIMKMNYLIIQKNLMFLIIFILILSESGRTPFDFIEGESELVSGFNIEYSSIYFSLFFIYEYGMMMFFSILMSMMFSNFFNSFFIMFIFILIRGSFPRFRYDQMMILIWKIFYPLLMVCCILLKIL